MGLFYVLGAGRRNSPLCLKRALAKCARGLEAASRSFHRGAWSALHRLRAQVLLRLRRYKDAFEIFGALALDARTEPAWSESLVAPFRLEHDAALLEQLSRLGRLKPSHAGAAAALHKALARIRSDDSEHPNTDNKSIKAPVDLKPSSSVSTCEDAVWWVRAGDLDELTVADLKHGLFNRLHCLYPYPMSRFSAWYSADPLRTLVNDSSWIQAQYKQNGIAVIDDFFSVAALNELWTYVCESTCFRTLRPGYLGAFLEDGCTHPALRTAAESLERQLPGIFTNQPLLLWWFLSIAVQHQVGWVFMQMMRQ